MSGKILPITFFFIPLRYEFEDSDNDAYKHEKEVQNMRRMATIVFGGIFQKQKCLEFNMCNVGRAIRENNESAMEFALMWVTTDYLFFMPKLTKYCKATFFVISV